MGGFWETIEVIAGASVLTALGLAGDVHAVYKVSYWAYEGVDEWIQNSDGTRTYKCGICGEEGHNRRTCDENVTCDGCGNEEPDEVWEAEGNTVCDECF